jgi:hypothetical protein
MIFPAFRGSPRNTFGVAWRSFGALAREMIGPGLVPYEFVSIEPPARNTRESSVILPRV